MSEEARRENEQGGREEKEEMNGSNGIWKKLTIGNTSASNTIEPRLETLSENSISLLT